MDSSADSGVAKISSCSATLPDVASSTSYASGLGSLSNTTTTITQWVESLVAGHTCYLTMNVVDSAGRTWMAALTVRCTRRASIARGAF